MRSLLAASGLFLAMLMPASAEPVRLAPHRAVYDISLLRSEGPGGIESAKGRIVMDFSGDACEGYALKYRQVTVLETGGAGRRTVDTQTATFESGDGRFMRFKSSSSTRGSVGDSEVDGDARLGPNGTLNVRFKTPRRETFEAAGTTVFPTEHLKRLIEAARKGERLLPVKVYDGSNDGKKVYDTLGIVGRKVEAGEGAGLEEPVRQEALAGVPRWPVTISYFEDGQADRTPAYRISFELYENGISRALTLDYGDFAFKGDLKSLEILEPTTSCQR